MVLLSIFLKKKGEIKEVAFFNIISEKSENTIVLKMAKIPKIHGAKKLPHIIR